MSWQTREMIGEVAPAVAILIIVIAILWYIFPYLPSHPPKKKK